MRIGPAIVVAAPFLPRLSRFLPPGRFPLLFPAFVADALPEGELVFRHKFLAAEATVAGLDGFHENIVRHR